MADLELKGVTKTFGDVPVIHGVDLTVNEGEFVVFVGPSGCGKSTLLRMIAGLESTSSGAISIGGKVVNDLPAAQRGVAMVFQSYALYPHMSVRQNMSFGLENIGMPRPEIERRLKDAARLLQVEPLLDRRPGQLSGGQRQRVAIGRAIVRDPKIFLFDEPLSNLDAELRVAMRVEISKLHDRLGNTMVYVTHDQTEAMTMADKIVVLRGGRIEQVGAPLELYNSPRNQFVAGFIGSPRMNFLPGRVASRDETRLSVAVDGLPAIEADVSGSEVSAGAEVVLGIRPEHIEIGEGAGQWRAEVSFAEHFGSSSFLHCDLTSGHSLIVHEAGQSRAERGSQIPLLLPPNCVHVFVAETGRALPRASAAAVTGAAA